MGDKEATKPQPKGAESRIMIGRGGWILYDDPELGAEVRLQLSFDEDGEIEIVALLVQAASGLDGTLLREIPLGSIVARIRASQAYLWVKWARRREGEEEEASRRLRELDDMAPPTSREAVAEAVEFAALARLLKQHAGRAKRPDEFYALVAQVFTRLSANSRRPAKDMASNFRLPESTVHRWVKEARRRGLFTPHATDSETTG